MNLSIKKILLAALAGVVCVASLRALPSDSSCPGVHVIVHGELQFVGVEGGCWQFVDDSGHAWEPALGTVSLLCQGQTGTLIGCTRPDLASTCQVGELVEVTQFLPDTFSVTGTMQFVDVAGGCWQFVSAGGVPYEPLDGPPELYVDGACGVLTGYAPCNLGSTCQVGLLVTVTDFEPAPGWTDLGFGLSGSITPTLSGAGALCADQTVTFTLDAAPASTTAWLVVGVADVSLAFLGGTLVPAYEAPLGLALVLATDPLGGLVVSDEWPAGVPAGTELFLQYWLADAGAPSGFSASNAIRSAVP